jgi:hypothetical protein
MLIKGKEVMRSDVDMVKGFKRHPVELGQNLQVDITELS